jgi:hypothetical protein
VKEAFARGKEVLAEQSIWLEREHGGRMASTRGREGERADRSAAVAHGIRKKSLVSPRWRLTRFRVHRC